MNCPTCNRTLTGQEQFCPGCGTSFSAPQQPQQPQQSYQPMYYAKPKNVFLENISLAFRQKQLSAILILIFGCLSTFIFFANGLWSLFTEEGFGFIFIGFACFIAMATVYFLEKVTTKQHKGE